jgi:putative copper export protein
MKYVADNLTDVDQNLEVNNCAYSGHAAVRLGKLVDVVMSGLHLSPCNA